MDPSDNLVLAAAEYLNAGLSIIALSGKLPNTKWHPHGLNDPIFGILDSREDVAMLVRVFEEDSRTTGIGIVIPDHMVVVDIDGDEGAVGWMRCAEAKGFNFIPETPVAKTGRGMHIYYMTPIILPSAPIAEKLDRKGPGGYVVAPPSVHTSGVTYRWLVPLVVNGAVRGVEWFPYG